MLWFRKGTNRVETIKISELAACELSLGELKQKRQVINLIQSQKTSKDDIAKKHISPESISLIQSLLILLF